MSNQVPFGVAQITQSRRLPRKFLHPVLAEDAQSGAVRLADTLNRKSLANSHQSNFIRIAPNPTRSRCDPLSHQHNIFRDRHTRKKTRKTEQDTKTRSRGDGRLARPNPKRILRRDTYIIPT